MLDFEIFLMQAEVAEKGEGRECGRGGLLRPD